MRLSFREAAAIGFLLACTGCMPAENPGYDAVMNGPDTYDAPAAFTGGVLITHPAYGFSFRVPEGAEVWFSDKGVSITGYGEFHVIENPERFEQDVAGITQGDDARILFREHTNDYDLVFFQSVGQCSYKKILMKMGDWEIESSGRCDAEPIEKWTTFVRIARSFTKPVPEQVTPTPFDGCAAVSSYADEDWYMAFTEAALSIGMDYNENPGFGAGCMAKDRSIFIAQWEGATCLGRVVRYDIAHGRFAVAKPVWKNPSDPSCEMAMEGFGKRSGDVIPVKGVINVHEDCYTRFDGSFNIAKNVVTWTSQGFHCPTAGDMY